LIHILNVTGPGEVSASGISMKAYPRRGSTYLYGVDIMALDPTGNYLYVSNPSIVNALGGISVIDLTLKTQVESIRGTGYPTGIAFQQN